MTESKLTVAVIIPTMNRPAELDRCVRSILAQSRLPEELIIVDDGNLEPRFVESILGSSPIRYFYVAKDRKGLCRSRNFGLARSSGDIVIFLDDDTELDRDYVRALAEIFEQDVSGSIAGVSGTPQRFLNGVEHGADARLTWDGRLERFFLIAGARGGKMLPSGFRSPMLDPGPATPVDFLQGGNMALRRRLIGTAPFDESLDRFGGYSLGEDVFFSYPLGRKYRLLSTSKARMKHFTTPGNRPDREVMNRMRVIHQYRFMHETMRGGVVNHLAFAWAVSGLLFINTIVLVRRPTGARFRNLRGLLSGIGAVLRRPGGAEPGPGTMSRAAGG